MVEAQAVNHQEAEAAELILVEMAAKVEALAAVVLDIAFALLVIFAGRVLFVGDKLPLILS